jgi:hypothetical protein
MASATGADCGRKGCAKTPTRRNDAAKSALLHINPFYTADYSRTVQHRLPIFTDSIAQMFFTFKVPGVIQSTESA